MSTCLAKINKLEPIALALIGGAVGFVSWGCGTESWRLLPIILLPLLWGFSGSRWSASFLMLGYYLGGARGLPGGTAVFFGDSSIVFGLCCYLAAASLLTLPFAILWSRTGAGWRFLAAVCISILPPLAFVGWLNPLAVAGAMFPGMAWIGLIIALALMYSLAVRNVIYIVLIGFIGLVANFIYVAPVAPAGWTGVDTHFERLGSGGDIGQVIDARRRVDWLVSYADGVPANSVHVLPETVLGPVGDSARFMLADTSARLAKRGSRLLVGGELNLDDGRYQNALLVVGAKKSEDRQAVQGIPVPVSMWHPFGKAGAVADVWGHSGLIEVAGKKTGVLICYEQLLTYSVLWMVAEKPDVLVGASNLWWVTDKTIPVIQTQMMMTFGRLFGVPVVRAVNESVKT